MITSVFSKSKPINFVIVFFVTLLAFIVARLALENTAITLVFLFNQIALFLVCYSTIFLLNFIVTKNSLSKKGNYEILLFSLFLLALSITTIHANILLSNFFVLLGLRRILSLRSQISVKKKLFDAAFCIAIAAFFYFWSILFFLLIPISLLLYNDNKINHWVIPFIGIITVIVIGITIALLFNVSFFDFFKTSLEISYNFNPYNSVHYLIAITLLLSFGIWSLLFYNRSIKQKKKVFRASYSTILIAVLLAFIIVVLAPKKDGSEFLFLFAPLAIVIANYIEVIQDKWFKEVFVSVLILAPFILLLL